MGGRGRGGVLGGGGRRMDQQVKTLAAKLDLSSVFMSTYGARELTSMTATPAGTAQEGTHTQIHF